MWTLWLVVVDSTAYKRAAIFCRAVMITFMMMMMMVKAILWRRGSVVVMATYRHVCQILTLQRLTSKTMARCRIAMRTILVTTATVPLGWTAVSTSICRTCGSHTTAVCRSSVAQREIAKAGQTLTTFSWYLLSTATESLTSRWPVDVYWHTADVTPLVQTGISWT